jgi:hypothetical protein
MTDGTRETFSPLEEVLTAMGVDNISVLYYHLEKLGVKRNEIPDKPMEFSNALRVIFGQAASILEMQIVSMISSRIGEKLEQKITLAEALQKLKAERNAT